MDKYYTDERNVQILISLLKKNGIKKIIASPGVKNISFVASVQQDDYFTVLSSVDERSAAYMACGMAAESGEPVVITCTEATASRNYMPGLTEAYYRKLPVLAVTCTWGDELVGNLMPQSIDRSTVPNDISRESTTIPIVKDTEDEWICNYKINKALLELFRHGGGPVHLNLALKKHKKFNVKELPPTRYIERVSSTKCFDRLDLIDKKVAVYIGAHRRWKEDEIKVIDEFCSNYNGIVIGDHTSNFKGTHWVQFPLIYNQAGLDKTQFMADIMIHIGEVSGAYSNISTKEVWRVSPDGEIRDTFKKVRYVFEMEEMSFFESLNEMYSGTKSNDSYLNSCKKIIKEIKDKMPSLPFSNLWVAQQLTEKLPEKSVLHLGILNSLRSWNYFDLPKSIECYSNVGGFGIDGILSTLVGAALCNKNKMYYAVIGDLAFFYDLNALGNRHIGNNVRILLINNGRGVEFRNYNNQGAEFGEDADLYIAAAGHYGNQSPTLIKNYAKNLGFQYLKASNKEEFNEAYHDFVNPEITDKSIIFEIFTTTKDECDALESMKTIYASSNKIAKAKVLVKKVLGKEKIQKIKAVLRK